MPIRNATPNTSALFKAITIFFTALFSMIAKAAAEALPSSPTPNNNLSTLIPTASQNATGAPEKVGTAVQVLLTIMPFGFVAFVVGIILCTTNRRTESGEHYQRLLQNVTNGTRAKTPPTTQRDSTLSSRV